MKKNNYMMLSITILFISGCMTACQNSAPAKNSSVNQPVNKTANNSNQTEIKSAVNDSQPKTEIEKSSDDSLASPTEAYKTAFAARQKKDVKALKRVLSKDMLDFFAMMGESEKKTIDEELTELAEKPQAKTNESRNEKITGDRATLEYPDEQGKWKTMDFVKENGEWKLTFPAAKSPVITDTGKKHN